MMCALHVVCQKANSENLKPVALTITELRLLKALISKSVKLSIKRLALINGSISKKFLDFASVLKPGHYY